MTITPAPPSALPTRRTPLDLARGILTGAVIGSSLAALVVGTVLERVPLLVGGLAVPIAYGLLVLAAGAPERAREAAIVPRTTLAKIESLRATGGETSDVPVRFDLTVAPDGGPAYRVESTQSVNLVDLPDYKPGGIVVVQYPPHQPWAVKLVKRPTPEWEDRATAARIDSAPGPALTDERPSDGTVGGYLTLLALLLGAAGVVFAFRADLFGPEDHSDRPPSAAGPAEPGTSSTTIVSAASGTVALGPGQSLFDEGRLRRAVDSLTKGEGRKRQALTVVVQDRLLTVVFTPVGSQAPGFDLDALPYPRIPALVREARATLGVRSPQTWQLTAESLSGALTLRVGVAGADGVASLEANGHGEIVRRVPAR
ncbi:hypothetical protein [Streptomyces poriferorum]|uniref:DUF3592 domain-containing protein n=1 Tax=Streptomyces poriferorum TaxID=2798799 RepID=A0ABY9IRR0_9ACTN|nr:MULTISPECIES: hypothetical protein [unclassified Streptomyces]MDP5313071.1 hypothetical protein [Streptomyces sp. Alt4]WLQ57930.1 hypothetical protein P8A19_21950 [Streptomyces sp. Alt2]